ncbi:hypothetical protein BT96DRAFT_1026695 [Gymnopus androsaceus JB14]|uniref:Mug135-like C-terminal domain-containing protein n=1 Tax=Gymnopus androsaceus JB14 TaxID=1447944 RepID=A0A6A4GI15_9AGAR|nr:hypothetical protein BT96DRAFT_1026695 [Gymnopus androsaceus JB14]
MALPLTQVVLPPSPQNVLRPANSNNPPTPADIMNSTRYKKQIYDELASNNPNVTLAHYADATRYEHKLVAAFDLSQLPPLAGIGAPPAPAPAAPLIAGITELLAGQQRILNTLAGIQTQLAQIDRRSAFLINQTRGNGVGKPYDEVRFTDNSLPSQPSQGRAVLPVLNTMLDIRALSGPDVTTYLRNHGILPANIPHLVADRREKLAEIIGCTGYHEP